MSTTICPFLMFEGKAEEAMTFYASLFPGSATTEIRRYGAEGPGMEGSIMVATFKLGDQTVMCSDSSVKHAFTFTPSFSFFVTCENEEQIQRLVAAFLEGGSALMPLGDYGFSRQFAWISDRYGVSWQLNLP